MTGGKVACVAAVLLVSGCVGGFRPSLNSPDPAARIRAIRQAAENGDRGTIPLLVDRLEDEDEAVRFYAIAALVRMTGTDRGYRYYKPFPERLAAVKRWRHYVRERPAAAPTTQTVSSGR